jgi:uncharacterized protein YggE
MEAEQPPLNQTPQPTVKKRWQLANPWLLVSLVLLVVITVIVVLWKPWQASPKASDRTISVSGVASLKAEPDEYRFFPYYQVDNSDKQAALTQLTQKSDQIVAKLKSLGVPDNKIKVDSNGYQSGLYESAPGSSTYNLSIQVTVDKKDLAQKVQDYLLTTTPSGSITPQATFSTAKQKSLEDQARDKAEQDARKKADQSAKNLGFKLGSVKSVQDGGFYNFCFSGVCPLSSANSAELKQEDSAAKMSLQPGENELNFAVSVTYYIH